MLVVVVVVVVGNVGSSVSSSSFLKRVNEEYEFLTVLYHGVCFAVRVVRWKRYDSSLS